MADQILSVSFKINTGNIEGDAAAAGKLAAKAFEQGFGALDLKTPMAKAGEAAQAQTAAIGKTLQGAAMQHADAVEKALAGAGGEKGGGGGKALAIGGLLGGLLPKHFGRDIAESAEVGAKGLGTLRAAFAGIAEFVATGSFASASRSIQEVAQSAGETAEGFGSIGGAIAKATPYVAAFVGTAGAGAVATKELAEKGADAVLSMDALSKSSGLGLGQLLGWREAARHQGIDFDEFSRGLARMNVAQTTARAEIEKRATEEPLDLIDAQRRVVQAYRAREAAVDAVGGAENKVISARARIAELRVGGREEAAITEARGPLSVAGAQISADQATLDDKRANWAYDRYEGRPGPTGLEVRQANEEQARLNRDAADQRSADADLQLRQAQNQERERIAAQRAGAGPGGAGTLTPVRELQQTLRDLNQTLRDRSEAEENVPAADRGIVRARGALNVLPQQQITGVAEMIRNRDPRLAAVSPDLLFPAMQMIGQSPGQRGGTLGAMQDFFKAAEGNKPLEAASNAMMRLSFGARGVEQAQEFIRLLQSMTEAEFAKVQSGEMTPADQKRFGPIGMGLAVQARAAEEEFKEKIVVVALDSMATTVPALAKGFEAMGAAVGPVVNGLTGLPQWSGLGAPSTAPQAKAAEEGARRAPAEGGAAPADMERGLLRLAASPAGDQEEEGGMKAPEPGAGGASPWGVAARVGGGAYAAWLGTRLLGGGVRLAERGAVAGGKMLFRGVFGGVAATAEASGATEPGAAPAPEAGAPPVESVAPLEAAPAPTTPEAPAAPSAGTSAYESVGGPFAAILPALSLLQAAISGMNAARATSLGAARAEGPLTPAQLAQMQAFAGGAPKPPETPSALEAPKADGGAASGAAGALSAAGGALSAAAGELSAAAGALSSAGGAAGGSAPVNATEKADGGLISGTGSGTSDSNLAWVSDGEYIVKADRVQQVGVPFLDRLNAGKFEFGGLVRGFAEGGEITPWAGDPVNVMREGDEWRKGKLAQIAAEAKATAEAKEEVRKNRPPEYGSGSLDEANKGASDLGGWEGYRIPVAGESRAPDPAKGRDWTNHLGKLSDVKEMADVLVDYGWGNKKTFKVQKNHEPERERGPELAGQADPEDLGDWDKQLDILRYERDWREGKRASPPSQKRHESQSPPGLEIPFDSLPEVHEHEGSASHKPIRIAGALAHHHRAHHHRPHGDDDMWNPDRKLAFGGLVGFASGGLARVSNGEYRVSAGAVTKYGAGVMAMLNSGQFSSGGLVGDADTSNPGRFDDWGNGLSRGLSSSLPPGISSEDRGSSSQHTLDLVTSAGQFRMQASHDTIEAIRASAIGQKLTSAGVKPSWY